MKKIEISTVVITKNRIKYLTRCLHYLSTQVRPPDEFILIEDISDNQNFSLKKLMKFFSKKVRLKYLPIRNGNYAKSRNLGIKNSTGRIVLFVDDDVILPYDYIKKIIFYHKKYSTALGFVGKVVPIFKNIFTIFGSKYLMSVSEFKNTITQVDFYPSTVISLTRSYINKYNVYFDEKLNTGEDIDFFLCFSKKGKRLYFIPNLVVKHSFVSNPVNFFKRHLEYSRDFAYLHKKHPEMNFLVNYFPSRKLEFIFFPFFLFRFVRYRIVNMQKSLRIGNNFVIPITIQAIANLIGVYGSKFGRQELKNVFLKVFNKD